jgi:hypothetical protein
LADVYQDQMSGAKASRPGLDKLVAGERLLNSLRIIIWNGTIRDWGTG